MLSERQTKRMLPGRDVANVRAISTPNNRNQQLSAACRRGLEDMQAGMSACEFVRSGHLTNHPTTKRAIKHPAPEQFGTILPWSGGYVRFAWWGPDLTHVRAEDGSCGYPIINYLREVPNPGHTGQRWRHVEEEKDRPGNLWWSSPVNAGWALNSAPCDWF